MTPEKMHRVDRFYAEYLTVSPKQVADLMKSRFLYIPRLEPHGKYGRHITMVRHQFGRREGPTVGTPLLESWFADYYHPHIKLELLETKRGIPDYFGHIELFKLPLSVTPNEFSDPEVELYEVYRCCAAITYDLLYAINSPGNEEILRTIRKHNKETGVTLSHMTEEINAIVDQKILRSYKSLPNLVKSTADYIRTKVNQ